RRLPPARHAGLGSARPAAAGDAGTESGLIQRRLLAQQPVEILSIAVLAAVAVGSGPQLLRADIALAPGNLLGRGDLEALPLLHRGDEVRRIQQAVRRAGIEPGEAAAEQLDAELFALQIDVVQVGDLEFAAGG